MAITITDRWGNEIDNLSISIMRKTISDVFLDKSLPEISITDGEYHIDIVNNGWVYLQNDDSLY